MARWAKWAKGRKVIAPKDILWTRWMTDIRPYPFDVTLLDEEGEKDITYRVSIEP